MTNISSARDIASFIQTGVLGTVGTDIFIGKEPKGPDAVITVYDTSGEASQAGFSYEKPSVQVRVRGEQNGYAAAYSLIKDIFDLLHGKSNTTIGVNRYIGIWAIDNPTAMGQDENERPIFVLNLRIHRTITS